MATMIATGFVCLLAAYAVCGMTFALWFLRARLDAPDASMPFRLILIPGLTALWPLLARRRPE